MGLCVGCVGEGLVDVVLGAACSGACSGVVQALKPHPTARSIALEARNFILELFRSITRQHLQNGPLNANLTDERRGTRERMG